MRFLAKALAALMALSFAVSANELRYDNLYVIGDSLSDGGAYSQAVPFATGGALPPNVYRFTNNALDGSSVTYAEGLAQLLGITLDRDVITAVPANGDPEVDVGGNNYAQGGSRVTDPTGIGFAPAFGITTVPLAEQVDRLLVDQPTFGANDLIIVWGGANDVFAQANAVGASTITAAQANANMSQAATELVGQVDRLRAAGARTIIVVTVPDIGQTPFGLSLAPGDQALQTNLSQTFNDTLTSTIAGRAVIVDSQRLLSAVQADPVRYGFTAPNAATVPGCPGTSLLCAQGVNASADSNERIFADGVHPSARAHQLFAQAAFAGLQAATQAGAIPVATLTALRQQTIALDNRMNPTVMFYTDENGQKMRRGVGDIDVFGSLEFGFYESDPQQITPGIEGTTQVARVGFDVPVSDRATVGAGISMDFGQVDFAGNRGGFDSQLVVGAVFGQVSLTDQIYLNGAVGGGVIDVHDITRSFALGPAQEVYKSSTDGTYGFARIGGGLMLPASPSILINPYAAYTYENVSIDGYTEPLAPVSLSFGDMEYDANRITIGVNTVITPVSMPGWAFNVRASMEHDLNDDDLSVSLGPNPMTLGSVSAPRPDQTWGYLSGSVARDLGNGSLFNVSLSTLFGQNNTSGYVAAISYKKSF